MPQRCLPDAQLDALAQAQDWVISRDQAIAAGLRADAIRYRLRRGQWQRLLPETYLTHQGEPSRREKLIAALLFAGSEAAIDAADACRFHGVRYVSVEDDRIHVVVPWGSPARSAHFVVVRRTLAPIHMMSTERLRYVDPATAVIAATRRMTSDRAVLAALSDSLQRRITSYDELVRAHVQGPPRNSRHASAALEHLGAGTRSAPEADFRKLILASTVLPAPVYNAWLRLSTRRVVCVDALFTSSAVIHETNGRLAHGREDLFDDMQERHDALTAEGFTVLHNTPRRLRLRGRDVVVELERCHARNDGRGLPAGVERLAMAA